MTIVDYATLNHKGDTWRFEHQEIRGGGTTRHDFYCYDRLGFTRMKASDARLPFAAWVGEVTAQLLAVKVDA